MRPDIPVVKSKRKGSIIISKRWKEGIKEGGT
jgi:hypothetical protein